MRIKQYLLILATCLFLCTAHAQEVVPMSVRDLAPDFGIRALFLDDTIHVTRYLDSLHLPNTALTDTCVTLNAKLMAMENVLKYDYRHHDDTVWIDANHYLADYGEYSVRIANLSQFILDRAHLYIEREHIRQDNLKTTALSMRKDSIDRLHRTIINACEGIGINDKERKKELKDIYYSYLSVYNRYDLSMKRSDSSYMRSLKIFSKFQQDLIEDLLSPSNYTARIQNFSNTLKVRCGKNHTDVLRSYQRVFRQTTPEFAFSTVRDYYHFIENLQNIIDIQSSYITAIEHREQIDANSKRIVSLYFPKSHDVAKTYQEVAATINILPAFNTLAEARVFNADLQEFIQVQDCYIHDYSRLASIQEHGDTITKNCGIKYSDVAKAYKLVCDRNPVVPKYQSLDDAVRFGREMERFETIQLQYDSIISLRMRIDQLKDTICKGWMSHLVVYNGFQNIRKNWAMTPTFIDIRGGSEFIGQLTAYYAIEKMCVEGRNLYKRYKQLESIITPEMQAYRNIRKAYNILEKEYLTIKAINHFSDLKLYVQQLDAFITVQETIMDKVRSNSAATIDEKLKIEKEIPRIESLLGL